MDKVQLRKDSLERVKFIKFGDPVTNVCAGGYNPQRHAYFVKLNGNTAQCTNGCGIFWDTDIVVIFPGHLDTEMCDELFAPIHAVLYGNLT